MLKTNATFLAIIPARGGSKGILKKNIVSLNEKPLIYYSIQESGRGARMYDPSKPGKNSRN